MIDVLIVEDDEELRRNFSDIVQHHIQMNLVSSVATCRKAINHLRQLNPDVLLVDLGLPDGDGIDVIKTITSNNLKTEALVVTIFGDENHVIQALEAGAVGYILKDEKNDEIANYILQMINGGAPVSPAIARHMLKRFKSETDVDKTTGLEILTNKEKDVLVYVSKGYTSKEISVLEKISYHTVVGHIKNIYKKLSINSRAEAVNSAFEIGLINHDAKL